MSKSRPKFKNLTCNKLSNRWKSLSLIQSSLETQETGLKTKVDFVSVGYTGVRGRKLPQNTAQLPQNEFKSE